ncbi:MULTISPECIES: MetQ/NlpA family ABC transporter substrate-binding protein [Fictibacillus]|uniref:Lipoprotein n=1 Tax=Fictibacillus terranigra TaxID=3058424 RepID=A0ABT8ECB6_9BACL|nr:MetQ/NlpA family ABC transporter substrate-binding protein [Fictibacillus sp. CENA-BCM004]MDN4075564.1 MetQ/NlpA family ABC transporter substrate-binding protein [Fictibacillus sp. CENA-BCM004]
MKKYSLIILVIGVLMSAFLSGCSGGDEKGLEKVKIGISGSDSDVWKYIAQKAEKEGIDLEIVEFSDYVRPNQALADGDIDANAFQTISYFNAFKKEHKLDLAPIATTVIAPMGVYSQKYKDVKDIPAGSTIALPNEATNMGRALLLLQSAGLIKLEKNFDGNGDLKKVVENKKQLKLKPVVAGQTPRVLPDVAASIINNGVAVDAGMNPKKDSIFLESKTAKPYINIIATRTEDKNKKSLKKIAKIYQSKETAKKINEIYKGATIPTFVPLSEIGE